MIQITNNNSQLKEEIKLTDEEIDQIIYLWKQERGPRLICNLFNIDKKILELIVKR